MNGVLSWLSCMLLADFCLLTRMRFLRILLNRTTIHMTRQANTSDKKDNVSNKQNYDKNDVEVMPNSESRNDQQGDPHLK